MVEDQAETVNPGSMGAVGLPAHAAVLMITLVVASLPGKVLATTVSRLAARVVDESGIPVPGVEVTITHRQESSYLKTRTTDKKGRFHLQVLVPQLFDDCFLLNFKATGYQPLLAFERLTPGQNLRLVYTIHQTNGADYHNQGVDAFRAGDVSAAEKLFLKALEIQPNLASSHHALAVLYLEQARYIQAAASAELAIENQPDDSRILEVLRTVYEALGNETKAQEAQRALRRLAEAGTTVLRADSLRAPE